jgi:hypothetical protein
VVGLLCGGHTAVLVDLVGVGCAYDMALGRDEKEDMDIWDIDLAFDHVALHCIWRGVRAFGLFEYWI